MYKFIFKLFAELLGIQIIGSIFSAVFYFPHFIYSIFTSFLFLWAIHSTFWQLANKDRKRIIIINNNLSDGEGIKKISHLKGAYISLPFFVFNGLITVLTYATQSDLLVEIKSLLNLPFIEFLPTPPIVLDLKYCVSRLIVDFVMYFTCIIGYISGSFNISITEKIFPKIIYKQNKK